VHRGLDGADLYFVVNTANERRSFDATFRPAAWSAQRWDAVTGSIRPAIVRRPAGRSGTTVALDLAPYESTIVVLAAGAPARAATPAAARTLPAPLDLSAEWRVRLGAAGAPAEWPALRSWTDDEATKYFSGIGVYEKTVDVPAAFLRPGLAATLDLGEPKPVAPGGPGARMQAWVDAPVREAAVVFVNGRRAGAAWCPPYTIDVSAFLRPGPNGIRIEAANLAINHMAGRALPDYKLLNLRYGTRFEPQDMDKVQPVPAGLFGPIRLVAAPAPPRAATTR